MAFVNQFYDVVLVETPAEHLVEANDQPPYPAIGVAYIGNYLEKACSITPAVIDPRLGRMTVRETVDQVISMKPKILGLSSMTYNVGVAARISEEVKKRLPGVVTVLGGFHAAALPEETLREYPTFDFVGVGEGEVLFSKLVEATLSKKGTTLQIPGLWHRDKEDGRIVNQGRGEIPPTLDELGEPGWHLLDQDIIKKNCTDMVLMTMRGCPFSCVFCARPYGQIVRKRTADLVVDEIERSYERYGVKIFEFWDETFTVDKKHTQEICKEIIARNLKISWRSMTHANTLDVETAKLMKESGCMLVALGVESGDPTILKQMGKNVTKERVAEARNVLKQVGIRVRGLYIFGHPHETFKTIFRTVRFATKLNAEETCIGILVPYPGTETYQMALKGEGGYRKMSLKWSDYNKQIGSAIELKNISRRQLEICQLLAYFWLFIVRGKWSELYKTTTASNQGFMWRAVLSIVIKILNPTGKTYWKWFSNSGTVPQHMK